MEDFIRIPLPPHIKTQYNFTIAIMIFNNTLCILKI
jgi:hypothetical protein